MDTRTFGLTWKDLMDFCSSKNSFLHTRNYTISFISPTRKGKSANSGLYHSVYLFGMGYGCKSSNKTLLFQLPHCWILQVEWWKCQQFSTRKPYGSKQSSFLVIMMIRVMFRAGFCHGSWWFMSWFVVICSDLWFVVIHVMVNLWWFIVICGDLWWFMSLFVVVHVMVCGGLWYFHFHCSFSQNMGLLPLILIVLRSYPYFVKVSCKSVENWLRYWPKRSVLVET